MVEKIGSIGSGEEQTISPGSDIPPSNSSHEATEMASTEEVGVGRIELAGLTLGRRTSFEAAIGKEVDPARLIYNSDTDDGFDESVLEPEFLRELALDTVPPNDCIWRLHRRAVRLLDTKPLFVLDRGSLRALERLADGNAGTPSWIELLSGDEHMTSESKATDRMSSGLLAERGGFGARLDATTPGSWDTRGVGWKEV